MTPMKEMTMTTQEWDEMKARAATLLPDRDAAYAVTVLRGSRPVPPLRELTDAEVDTLCFETTGAVDRDSDDWKALREAFPAVTA